MLKGLPHKAKFARRQIILDHVRGNKLDNGISKVFIVLIDEVFNNIDTYVAGAVPIDAAGNSIVAASQINDLIDTRFFDEIANKFLIGCGIIAI